ncbi:hypothetical protein ScPMuIL_016682 [Solemya velum]
MFWPSSILLFTAYIVSGQNRSFTIDYDNNTFLKDGEPFRYISGSIHYSRIPPIYWKDRLMKMYVAGLNAIQIYIPWNFHEPVKGVYNFTGAHDVEGFIKLAQDVGLVVILRSGPYICGEWEFGGLPAWMLKEDPTIQVRTSDPTYLQFVGGWYDVLYPKIKPLLYVNGGPIITVQIENEYGSYFACDYNYLRFLREKAVELLGTDVILFSTDGSGAHNLQCGSLEGVYTTVDFGPTGQKCRKAFFLQRQWEPRGPLVNSELYTGWLDHWGKNHSVTHIDVVAKSLDLILSMGANVNMYMFEGGTNFGYWNGANYPPYQSVPTSYDYDAPLTEAGDITDKYIALRQIISKYNPVPKMPIPPSTPKHAYGKVSMVFDGTVQDILTRFSPPLPVNKSQLPLTMEQIGSYYGYILYRHVILVNLTTASILSVPGVRDRANVMVNGRPLGVLERGGETDVNITGTKGQYLDILVENQGRIGFGSGMLNNSKGIISNVLLNGSIVEGWEIYPLPLEDLLRVNLSMATGISPSIYVGNFSFQGTAEDTYLDMTNFSKGQVFINGFNLGRYWPSLGPQIRLYVPKSALLAAPSINYVMLFETENVLCPSKQICAVEFMDTPLINATVPAGSSEEEGQEITFLRR